MKSSDYKIAVLISGSGTTLKNLIEKRDQGTLNAQIAVTIASRADASGIQHAVNGDIPVEVVDHKQIPEPEFSQKIFDQCRLAHADLVVMGGFLRKAEIPTDFEHRVINIHPSLIPAFCGRGNYGIRVHRSVVEYGCKVSGCTVHFVDNQYDHGPIIAQRVVPVCPDDTPEILAARIFVEECDLYPQIINAFAQGEVARRDRVVQLANPPRINAANNG